MQKKLEITAFTLGWFAVIAQFVLILQNRQTDIPETMIRFFSFFTILTNLLVALYFTFKIFRSPGKKIALFDKNGALTAITTFILVVGLVYQFVLRQIWQPEGMQRVVDELLHSIIPFLVLVYWIAFSKKEKVSFRAVALWLLYPVGYLFFVLIRGSFSNFYPYPFLNIPEIGIEKALVNIALIVVLFLFIMAVLVAIINRRAKK